MPNCLSSIIEYLRNSDISFKILILENGSGEDLSDIQGKYKRDFLEIYYSDKNLGFGAGHNFLVKKEQGKYLFALNPDTLLFKNCIEELFVFMEMHQKVGLSGPRVEEPLGFWHHKHTFWPSIFIVKNFFEKFFKIRILNHIKALEFNPILGSALFFRREAFDEINGFDENLFLYFEEGDICNSLKMKGWKIFFVYNAAITHFYYKSHTNPPNIQFYEKSRAYFYKKWPNGDIE